MNELSLQAQPRTEMKKQTWDLRRNGIIPAVVYGGKQNFNIKINLNEFTKIYKQAGENTIIKLKVEGQKEIPVLVQAQQLDPVYNIYTHVDFKEIDMNKEIVVPVKLDFIGEAPALKELGGTLVKNMTHVDVRVLPANLIHGIKVDLSSLKTFADAIHVRDLQVPSEVKLLVNPEFLVAKVVEQKAEVEVAPAAAAAAPAAAAAAPAAAAEEKPAAPAKK